ncbi:hypothetical protein SGCOL_008959 [Colletotrichum sp. CLE4]
MGCFRVFLSDVQTIARITESHRAACAFSAHLLYPSPQTREDGLENGRGYSGGRFYSTAPTDSDPHRYQTGFENRFASEAVPGTLPLGQNAPRKCKFDLYSEQLNWSAFVSSRATLQHVWMYRIWPSVAHRDVVPPPELNPWLQACFSPFNERVKYVAAQQAWDPFPLPGEDGDAGLAHGPAGGVAVIQAGLRLRISLPDGPCRDYIQEIFGSHYELPELEPLESNRMALSQDFQSLVASFDIDSSEREIVYKMADSHLAAPVPAESYKGPFNAMEGPPAVDAGAFDPSA